MQWLISYTSTLKHHHTMPSKKKIFNLLGAIDYLLDRLHGLAYRLLKLEMSSTARSAIPAFASQVESGLLWYCQWPGRPVIQQRIYSE